MAALPDYVSLEQTAYSLQDASIVERSEVERGPAKTRRTATDPMITLNGSIFFKSRADIAAFRAWLYSATGANAGAAWFDWTDPRTDTVRQIRFVSMGALTPLAGRFAIAQQPVVFEYLETVEQILAVPIQNADFTNGLTGWNYYDFGDGLQGTASPYSGVEGKGVLLTRPTGSVTEIGVRQSLWGSGASSITVTPGQQFRLTCTTTRKSGTDGGNIGLYGNFRSSSGVNTAGHFTPTPAVSPATPSVINGLWTVPADIVGLNLEIYWGSNVATGSVAITNIAMTAI